MEKSKKRKLLGTILENSLSILGFGSFIALSIIEKKKEKEPKVVDIGVDGKEPKQRSLPPKEKKLRVVAFATAAVVSAAAFLSYLNSRKTEK